MEVGLMIFVVSKILKTRVCITSRKTRSLRARSLVIGFLFSAGMSIVGLRNLCILRMEMKQRIVLAVPMAWIMVCAFEEGLRRSHSGPETARVAMRMIPRTGMIWQTMNHILCMIVRIKRFCWYEMKNLRSMSRDLRRHFSPASFRYCQRWIARVLESVLRM